MLTVIVVHSPLLECLDTSIFLVSLLRDELGVEVLEVQPGTQEEKNIRDMAGCGNDQAKLPVVYIPLQGRKPVIMIQPNTEALLREVRELNTRFGSNQTSGPDTTYHPHPENDLADGK